MTKVAMLALLATLSSAFAVEEFGGVKFHKTVEKNQIASLKNDLRYLYVTPIKVTERDFLKIAQIKIGDGPNMHNWLLNRVRYVYGEKFAFDQKDMIFIPGKFPNTPMPELPGADEESSEGESTEPTKNRDEEAEEPRGVTVMSNMGAALYLMGKANNIFIGFNFDGEKFYAKSPRTGILQVGEGLFLPQFRFNKEVDHSSNSISRLSTLFHEARHSDGNSKHTGFVHALCPIGHSMAGNFACEGSANGPYTIGALSQKHLLKNCPDCSAKEKTALLAGVADSFSRIIELPLSHKMKDYRDIIETNDEVIKTFEDLSEKATEEEKAQYTAEVIKLKSANERLNYSAKDYEISYKIKAKPLDPTPEGIFTVLSLEESMKMMAKSLKKK